MQDNLENAVKAVYAELNDKFAEDISVLRVADISPLADYFIIATAGSQPQLRSLGDAAEKKFKEFGVRLLHTEDYKGSKWVLLDFGVVILHLFLGDEREFYNLDAIWRDAEKIL